MKTINQITPWMGNRFSLAAGLGLLILAVLAPCQASAADEPTLTQRAKETVNETTSAVTSAVQDASQSAADSLESLWQRLDQSRLRNRTRDEIAAWIIMGILVGAVAGMMTSLKSTGLGKVGRLLLGLAGAFIGGMVVHATQINFGWGPVLIRYEELFFSLVGAILLILLGRLIRFGTKKTRTDK
jgi:uncharacterized membrane protein YeaQ/YmgE (transglycosylase-associated protein family)